MRRDINEGTDSFQTFLKFVIDKQANEFGGSLICVDEPTKALIDASLEEEVRIEAVAKEADELVAQLDDIGNPLKGESVPGGRTGGGSLGARIGTCSRPASGC